MSEEKYDECDKLIENNCKLFRRDPYWTPNNYDLYFDYNNIPVNIKVEKAFDLVRRLQRTMPLTKIIHLNMETETIPRSNGVSLHTNVKIGGKPVLNLRE